MGIVVERKLANTNSREHVAATVGEAPSGLRQARRFYRVTKYARICRPTLGHRTTARQAQSSNHQTGIESHREFSGAKYLFFHSATGSYLYPELHVWLSLLSVADQESVEVVRQLDALSPDASLLLVVSTMLADPTVAELFHDAVVLGTSCEA